MRITWRFFPQCPQYIYLPGRIIHVIVTTDYVGYAHIQIINDDGQVIGRRTIRPADDQIIQFIILENDLATYLIIDNDVTV